MQGKLNVKFNLPLNFGPDISTFHSILLGKLKLPITSPKRYQKGANAGLGELANKRLDINNC